MADHDRPSAVPAEEPPPEPAVIVTACETRPGRIVFTEESNCDAWIATDLAVDLER